MNSYDINVIIGTSCIFIFVCVFFLLTEVLRTRPGCCWISPPELAALDDVERAAAIATTTAESGEVGNTTPGVVTPTLKGECKVMPGGRSLRHKRVKSASAGRFYAYNRSRSSADSSKSLNHQVRAKTAGCTRRSNGMIGMTTFRNDAAAEFYELQFRRHTVSFSPSEGTSNSKKGNTIIHT